MGANGFHLIGVGLYTTPEASRLARVSTGRIRRWMQGYTFKTKSGSRESPAVVQASLPLLDDGVLTLSFLDLQEIRFVNAFLVEGVKWKTLRIVHEKSVAAFGPHPFSRGRFDTDGRDIFVDLAPELGKSDGALLNIANDQTSFKRVVSPFLATLEITNDQAAAWWPLGKSKLVVLNPKRSFGQPIVPREGVPTNILARSYRVEKSYPRVARWYEVSERAVRHAVEYEEMLTAA
jgi:uncharacterized protein (DUF433 family)